MLFNEGCTVKLGIKSFSIDSLESPYGSFRMQHVFQPTQEEAIMLKNKCSDLWAFLRMNEHVRNSDFFLPQRKAKGLSFFSLQELTKSLDTNQHVPH